jgi:GNAT superfamily N-acetyltransferase
MGSFRKKTGKEALAKSGEGSFMSLKILGTPIGGMGEEDGDGDGFVTGPSGEDNVPAPIANAKDEVKKLWTSARAKQLKADEARAIKAAKAAKPPKYTNEQLHEALRKANRQEDKRGARKMARDWAKEIFEIKGLGDDGEFSAELWNGDDGMRIYGPRSIAAAHEYDPEPHIRIGGKIVDKDGKKVGIFERHIYLNSDNRKIQPYAYHEIFRIDKEYQGKGIGADFGIGAEAKYEALGIKSIHLNAGLDDGIYTWSRAGYNFRNDKDRENFLKDIEMRYQQLLKDAGGDKSKLIAGGFSTGVGRRYTDSGDMKAPTPLFESQDHLEAFLKLLGAAKKQKLDDSGALPPSVFAMFPASKFMFRGMNKDMFRPVKSMGSSKKSIVITGLDKVFSGV